MLSVKFMRAWEYWEDPDGNNRRHIPAALVIELADDVAAAAIHDGAAVPNGAMTADVQSRLDALAQLERDLAAGVDMDRAYANMESVLAAAGGGKDAAGDDERSSETGDADTGEAKPRPKKAKAPAAPQDRPSGAT